MPTATPLPGPTPRARLRAPFMGSAVALLLAGCFGGSTSTQTDAPETPEPTHPLAMPGEAVGQPLATVDGRVVGTSALDAARGRVVPESGAVFSIEEKRAFLDKAVEGELLFLEAFRRGLYNDPAIQRSMVAALLREEIYEDLELPEHSEEAMRQWFLDHRSQFSIDERVHLQRIFLVPGASRDAATTKALADELRAKALAEPERFPDLAREHSDGPLALRSGDAGYLTPAGRPELPPAMVEAAFQLEEGEISEPIEHGGGWNILRAVAKRKRIDRTFEEVRSAVKRRMNQEAIAERQAAFVASLRDKAEIQVDEAALDAYRPPLLSRRTAITGLPEGQTQEATGEDTPSPDPRQDLLDKAESETP